MPYGIVNTDTVRDSSGGILAPISSVFRNRIINGAMVIDQRNAGASVTPTNGQYTLDRWQSLLSQASKYSVQQNSGNAPATQGFTQCLKITSLSAYTLGATDFFQITQPIEGNNIADLAWGTASGKTVTVSFWAYSSLTGSFSVALGNSAGNSWYPVLYSIPVANTWTQISVTVPAPPNGTTWLTTNGLGIDFRFSLGTGSTYSNTSGAWNSGQSAATGAVSVVGTNGATFYITGVQLEVGSSATGFEYRQYTNELALCQRYYQQIGSGFLMGNFYSSTSAVGTFPFFTQMRATPTAAITGAITITDTGANYAQSAATINSNYMQANGGALDLGSFTGLTAYRPYWYSSSNSSSRLFTFSAEL